MRDECYQAMYSAAYKGFHEVVCGIAISRYNWYYLIEPGHLVMEVSTAKDTDIPYKHRIGYLIDSSEDSYIIEMLDGEKMIWETALFMRMPTDVLLVAPCTVTT